MVDGLEFSRRMQEAANRIELCLATMFSRHCDSDLVSATQHALSGGKRLRGFIVIESARLHGVDDTRSDRVAAAIECVHAYSLVHDDLPCMDNDALRRGKPTVHVKWDEATAVLAGDGLLTLAFEILSDPTTSPDASIRGNLVCKLARAAGITGMVLGQAMDMSAETAQKPLSLAQIVDLHSRKTGRLIRWAAEAGPVLAGHDPAPMRAFAEALGQAFQITDDLLDISGDAEKVGKRLRKDAEAGKATFASILGRSGAEQRAKNLVRDACAALEPYGDRADLLRHAANFVLQRTY